MKNTKRQKIIRYLRKKGYTMQEIGNRFSITRQRVEQILKDIYFYRKVEYKVKCFSCRKVKITNRKREHNFCSDCWKKYFVRPSGTEYEGMDFARQVVRIRDNNICQKKHGGCGRIWDGKERRFDIHHLDGMCGQKSRSYDRVGDIKLLTTLCHKCHLNLPEVREKMQNKSSPRRQEHKKYQIKWARENKDWLKEYKKMKKSPLTRSK